jgi:glutamyl-tRNA reductase
VQALAAELDAKPRSMEQLEATLIEVDVLVAMTSSHSAVVDHDMVKRLRKQRRGRPLFLVDLSVPRNIDPRVNGLEDVFLYNIDDLSQIVAQTKSSRRGEADRAEQIVLEETKSFERSASAEQATPTVVALRRRLTRALRAELDKSMRTKLRHLSKDDEEALERMHEAAVNKILHGATKRLREAASNPADAAALDLLVSTLTDLFDLDTDDAVALQTIPPKGPSKDRRESVPAPAAVDQVRRSQRAGGPG